MRKSFQFLVAFTLSVVILGAITARVRLLDAASPPAKPSVAAPTAAQPAAEAKQSATAALRDRVAAALDKPVTFDFKDEPLEGVRKKLIALAGIPFELDEAALREADVRPGTQITFAVKDVSLRSALRLLLRPISLAATVTRDETLLITTAEAAHTMKVVRLYPVRDLIDTPDDLGEIQQDYKSLISVVTWTVRPQSWDAIGGPGTIQPIHGALAVDQTTEVHDEIAWLLADLREARQRQLKTPGGPAIQAGRSPAEVKFEARWRELLSKPWELEFKDQPLKKAMEAVGKHYQINVQFDEAALREAGVGDDTRVSFDLKGISLRAALRRILRTVKLTYVIKDEVLLITTQEAACQMLLTRLYPIADLVRFDNTADGGEQEFTADALIKAVYATVRPQSWDQVGGPGSILMFAPAKVLVVAQTSEALTDLDEFLAQLRANLREHPPAASAKQVAFEDRIITKVFELKPSTDRNYVAATDAAAIVKNGLGAKAWQVEGTLVAPVERVDEVAGDDQRAKKITRAALIVRNKPAVLRDARRLLKEMNVWPEPAEHALSGGGAAFPAKAPGGGAAFRTTPEKLPVPLTDVMPAPAKCDAHDGVCPAEPTKPAGP